MMMPVAYDALTARIAERAGFRLLCSAGYANSASLMGARDLGLLTLTEMADAASRMCQSVTVPVLADGDTGHGGTLNVRRTVRLHERAGCCGLILEDQAAPKRCGHMSGKSVVPVEEMLARLGAAMDAREDEDFAIVARTDARASEGFAAALERARSYLAAGADVIFVEAPQTVEELERVPREVGGPCMANMIPGGRTPVLPASSLRAMGYRIAAYPTVLPHAVAKAAERSMAALFKDGVPPQDGSLMDFEEFNRMLGPDEPKAPGRR